MEVIEAVSAQKPRITEEVASMLKLKVTRYSSLSETLQITIVTFNSLWRV
jgi:hypothetical protein